MHAGREPSGSFPSALARPFPAGLAVFPVCRPSTFSGRVHPSSSFPSPSTCSFDRLPAVPFRAPTFQPSPGRPASAFRGVSSLFTVSIEASTDAGFHAARQGLSRVTSVGTCPFGLSALGVSHALDGLLRLRSCGFVSSRCCVQGCSFRGFSLAADPFRISPVVSPPAVEHSSLRFPAPARLPSTSGVFSPLRVR